MRKLSIITAAIVTLILVLMFLPKPIIYLIGLYQIGSWIGEFVATKLDN
jgi:hypothetical protein